MSYSSVGLAAALKTLRARSASEFQTSSLIAANGIRVSVVACGSSGHRKAAREAIEKANGRQADVLREADSPVRAAHGLSIEAWTDDGLAAALDPVGRAWQLLEAEGLQHA